VDYLVAAADQAARGWAKQHAASLYRDALDQMVEDESRHAEIERKLAVALHGRIPRCGRRAPAATVKPARSAG
jgi:hypothetical protein